MKSIATLFLAGLLALSLAACGGQPSSDVPADSGGQLAEGFQLESTQSDTYTEKDFQENFPGCTMTSLQYMDALSADGAPEWADQYDADQAIVFHASFTVADPGEDSALKPNSTYPTWEWILVRSDGGDWTIGTHGQG